jgi:predicted DNA-binding protein
MTIDNMCGGMYAHATLVTRRVEAMARKKISTTVYITSEQNERLKLLHERTKVPIAVFIREGIDLVLEQHRDELPGQLTLDSSNKP